MREGKTKIAKARYKIGLSQKQMAASLNMQPTCYVRYELGQRIPNARTAIAIARALNSTVEELFGA